MKKYLISLSLPLLLVLACIHINVSSFQRIDASTYIGSISNNCFNTNFNYPDSEIERCTIYANSVFQTYQGSQKISVYPGTEMNRLSVPSLLASSTAFPVIELFDNNYLSYNYPSHHFW